MQMFKKMEEKLDSIQKTVMEKRVHKEDSEQHGSLQADLKKVNTKIKVIETKAATASEMSSVRKQVVHNRFMTKVQGGSLQRMQDMLEEVVVRMDNIELNANKKMITLTNLEVSSEKDIGFGQLRTFFENSFGFAPEMEEYFLIGASYPATVVIALFHFQEKKWILENKALLKNYRTNNRTHFISEYVPVGINEKRRRNREIAAMFPEQSVGYQRGKLQIDDKYYQPPITPPAPEDIISLSLEQLDKILSINIPNGDMFLKDGNEFTGYTLAVNNVQQIRDAYLKLRLIHPRARHIICAYILKNIDTPENKNFCDDDEISAGRILLDILQNNQMENRVIFVIRYFGENKIGQDRFKCIRQAAESVLEQNSYNSITGQEQKLRQDEYPSNRRGRGRTQRRPFFPHGQSANRASYSTYQRFRGPDYGRYTTSKRTLARGSYRDAASYSNRRRNGPLNYNKGQRYIGMANRPGANTQVKRRCTSSRQSEQTEEEGQDEYRFSLPGSVDSSLPSSAPLQS